MKRRIALLAALLWFAVLAYAEQLPDFRAVSWDMTPLQVRDSEPDAQLVEQGEYLFLRGALAFDRYEATLMYSFIDGKLFSGSYAITPDPADPLGALAQYREIQALLQEQNGELGFDESYWYDERLRDDPSRLGEALLEGEVAFLSGLSLPRTRIEMSLMGSSEQVVLSVTYTANDSLASPQ